MLFFKNEIYSLNISFLCLSNGWNSEPLPFIILALFDFLSSFFLELLLTVHQIFFYYPLWFIQLSHRFCFHLCVINLSVTETHTWAKQLKEGGFVLFLILSDGSVYGKLAPLLVILWQSTASWRGAHGWAKLLAQDSQGADSWEGRKARIKIFFKDAHPVTYQFSTS